MIFAFISLLISETTKNGNKTKHTLVRIVFPITFLDTLVIFVLLAAVATAAGVGCDRISILNRPRR